MTERRRGIQPFSADRLTPVEQAVEIAQEHQTCCYCDNLRRHSRSGARTCDIPRITTEDMVAVFRGLKRCEDYMPVRDNARK